MNAIFPNTMRRAVLFAPVIGVLLSFSSLTVGRADDSGLTLEPSGSASGGVDFAQLSLEDLMNVEVTSVSKSKQRIGEAPAAVTVITQEDIQRSGLHEIPEILRLAPGLFVQHGNQFTGTSISSRGFASTFADKLLVLQDGRTLYTPVFSGVYWNTVDYPIADLDRIEVIRGPGATLWGANAVNGVINITSKSAKDTQGALVDSRAGIDESTLATRYGGKIDDETFYRIYAKGRAFDDRSHTADPIGKKNQFQDSRGGFRIDRYGSDKDTLTFQGDTYYATNSSNNYTGFFVPNYTTDYRSGANLLARWNHVESPQSDYSLQLYWDQFNSRETLVDYHLNTFDIDFQQRLALNRSNEIMYGLGARLQMEQVDGVFLQSPAMDPADRNTHLLSAFVQDTITVVPERFKVVVGSKFEHNSLTGLEIQPSARAIWTPNETSTYWAAVSRAVRTPGRFQVDTDLNGQVPVGPGQLAAFHIGSEKPSSETLFAYELGHRRQINKALSIDISAFADIYDDLIDFRNQPPTFVGNPPSLVINQTIDNVRSAETFGFELAAHWQVNDRWRLSGSYSLLEMFIHDKESDVLVSDEIQEHSSPRNMAQLHSYFDVTRHVQFNTSAYYVEGTTGGNVLQSPGPNPGSYVRFDANVTWKPTDDLELSVGIQNAFDPSHFEAPFSGSASAEMERAVYGQLTWRF